MSRAMQDAFHDALEALAAGETLEEVIKSNPQYAEEIRPMLETALAATADVGQEVSEVGARERSRTGMLHYAAQKRSQHVPTPPFWARRRYSFAALSIAVIFFLSSTGIWVVSAQSLPGDPFYEIKRQAEALNRTLISGKASLYELDINYRQRRVDEVLRLIDMERVEAVVFEGVLQAKNPTLWEVANVQVIVHADTEQTGPMIMGDDVEVHGITTSSGAVLATTIELRRYNLVGFVLAQDGDTWVIADRWIDVSGAIVDDGIAIGSLVDVEVEVNALGVHEALLVKSLEKMSTAEPMEPPAQTSPTEEKVDSKDEEKYRGTLESMSGSAVVVDGQTIYLGDQTEIDGILSPGVWVSVDAALTESGIWIALEIKVEEDDELEGDELPDPEEGDEGELDPEEEDESEKDDEDPDDDSDKEADEEDDEPEDD